jgi:hypothetical protein
MEKIDKKDLKDIARRIIYLEHRKNSLAEIFSNKEMANNKTNEDYKIFFEDKTTIYELLTIISSSKFKCPEDSSAAYMLLLENINKTQRFNEEKLKDKDISEQLKDLKNSFASNVSETETFSFNTWKTSELESRLDTIIGEIYSKVLEIMGENLKCEFEPIKYIEDEISFYDILERFIKTNIDKKNAKFENSIKLKFKEETEKINEQQQLVEAILQELGISSYYIKKLYDLDYLMNLDEFQQNFFMSNFVIHKDVKGHEFVK